MYVIKVISGIATWFIVSINYCTMAHEQELIKEGHHFKASLIYRGWAKSPAEGNRVLDLYLRKYGTCIGWGFSEDALIYGAGF